MEKILNKKNIDKSQRAYLFVRQYIQNNEEKKDNLKKFRSCTIKLPTMIKVNGLIITLAFIKGKSEHKCIYDEICKYYYDIFEQTEYDDSNDIINLLMKQVGSKLVYREHINLVTTELLTYMLMIKKFSVAEINMILDE